MPDLKLEQALYKIEQRTDHRPRVESSIWHGFYGVCPCGWRFDTYSGNPLAALLVIMKVEDHEKENK